MTLFKAKVLWRDGSLDIVNVVADRIEDIPALVRNEMPRSFERVLSTEEVGKVIVGGQNAPAL